MSDILEESFKELDEDHILYADEEGFENKLLFALSTVGSSSDYRNDRDRPYNGQPWTDEGKRGQTTICGLSMRDMQDCFVKGVLNCCGADQPDLYKKIEENTWRVSDLWKVDGSKLDLLAVAQSMLCEVERMMGIFPNVDIKRNRHE